MKNTKRYKDKVTNVITKMATIEEALLFAIGEVEEYLANIGDSRTTMLTARQLIAVGDYRDAWDLIRDAIESLPLDFTTLPLDFAKAWRHLARAARLMV